MSNTARVIKGVVFAAALTGTMLYAGGCSILDLLLSGLGGFGGLGGLGGLSLLGT